MKIISKSQPVRFGSLLRHTFLPGVLVLFTMGTAEAQWTFEPILKAGVERDDNATLSVRTDDVLDVTGYLVDASVRMDFVGARSAFYITPRLLSRNYTDNPEIDSDDVFVRSGYTYTGQKSAFDLVFTYDEQTVRTAERSDADLDIDDPGDIPDDETGFVGFQDDREKFRLAPAWTYNFSDATSMNVRANFIATAYADSLQVFLNDYTDTRLTLGFDRAFSDRTVGIVEASVRKYKVDDGSSEADGVSLAAGFESSLSPTTTARMVVGIEDTDSTISQTDPAFTADLSLRRRLETVNILAQYRRSISASGVGKLSVRDTASLNLSRLLSEKIIVGIGARMYQTNSLDDVVTIDERNYVQLRSQFIWNMTPSFSAEVDYRYTFQKRAALTESSNSNQINLWFVYSPNRVDRRFSQQL